MTSARARQKPTHRALLGMLVKGAELTVLTGAVLTGSVLTGTMLTGTMLTGTMLTGSAVLGAATPAHAAGVAPQAGPGALAEIERNRRAGGDLAAARALQDDQKVPAALELASRGLAAGPSDPVLRSRLHRLRGELLSSLGRDSQAQLEFELAGAGPVASGPSLVPSGGVLVVLVPPSADGDTRARRPLDWPGGVAARTLRSRLAERLPGASVELVSDDADGRTASVAAARSWIDELGPQSVLSLRVDRSFCGESQKDGRFSVVWIRLAAANRARSAAPSLLRFVRDATHAEHNGDACAAEALARALDELLQRPSLAPILAASEPSSDELQWSGETLRALFPALGRRLAREVEAGRQLLARGEIEAARALLELAVRIDPEDHDARSYLAEAEQLIWLSQQLDARALDARPIEASPGEAGPSEDSPGYLETGLSAAELRKLETALEVERQRRDALLAALAVLEDAPGAPSPAGVAGMIPGEIEDPATTGPRLARLRSGDVVEARDLYTPSGSRLARFYFTPGASTPLLREEDTLGDGLPDRWTAYSGAARSDVWEDSRGRGRTDRHYVFARDGVAVERLELDTDDSGRVDRVLRYAAGRLEVEHRDTTGDGNLDVTDHLAPDGSLRMREEDRDGDGSADLRSWYRAGRLQRREIVDREMSDRMRRAPAQSSADIPMRSAGAQ